jgi:YCII-related domain
MRFLMLVKAAHELEAGAMLEEKLVARLATSHAELAKAGARLDAAGLQPDSKDSRITDSGGHRSFIDGPFAETKELIADCVVPDQQPGFQQHDGQTKRSMPRHSVDTRAPQNSSDAQTQAARCAR